MIAVIAGIGYFHPSKPKSGLAGGPRIAKMEKQTPIWTSNAGFFASSGVFEPLFQTLRWDTQPVGQAQSVDAKRRAEDAVLDVTAAGDGQRRPEHPELARPPDAGPPVHPFKERPV